MTSTKHKLQIAMFALFVSHTSTASAEGLTNNDNQNNGNNNPIVNAHPVDNTDRGTWPTDGLNSNQQNQKSAEERHQRLQQEQLDAFKRHLLQREQQISENSNLPDEVKDRQIQNIKDMQERRELFYKMMDQQRKVADERREQHLQQMNRI